jgi:saccharopine dehydrogenase-like NADP-dependent oxidoreductase
MKKILVLGAGRTSAPLIDYLLRSSVSEDWLLTVADYSLSLAQDKVKNHPNGRAIEFNIHDDLQREKEISSANLVISILPATLHIKAAEQCIKSKKHFLSASYISDAIDELNKDAKSNDLIFLNEMGVDPGIDHMDAKQLIDKIEGQGGDILSFKSYGGGLISPRSDDNCWGYKFTWSPVNVVNAGKAGGRYLKDGKEVNISYEDIFLDTEFVEIPGQGNFESYPNRDAIKYLKKYSIENVKNIYRGSLRKPGFCKAWNAIIKIGLTDSEKIFPESDKMTYKDWMDKFIPGDNTKSDKERLKSFLNDRADSEVIEKLMWLDLFNNNKIKVKSASSAQILQELLESKWKFMNDDSDMTILQTSIDYTLNSQKKRLTSSLIVNGYESNFTAMSRTVGLPLGIAAKLILQDKIKERGVIIPIHKDIYEPALKELKELGIAFKEEENTI